MLSLWLSDLLSLSNITLLDKTYSARFYWKVKEPTFRQYFYWNQAEGVQVFEKGRWYP